MELLIPIFKFIAILTLTLVTATIAIYTALRFMLALLSCKMWSRLTKAK